MDQNSGFILDGVYVKLVVFTLMGLLLLLRALDIFNHSTHDYLFILWSIVYILHPV